MRIQSSLVIAFLTSGCIAGLDKSGASSASIPASSQPGATPVTSTPNPGSTSTPASTAASVPPLLPNSLGARFDWVSILGTGQSLSTGGGGYPALDTTPGPNHTMMLTDSSGTWDVTNPNASTLSLIPLTEAMRAQPGPNNNFNYPYNIGGETPHYAMGAQIRTLAIAAGRADYVTVHSAVGQGGMPMSIIGKGGSGFSYPASIFEIQAIAHIAATTHHSYAVGAILLTHGEADALNGNPTYESDLMTMWSDYNTDLPQITGQTDAIPMILSQQSSCPENPNAPTTANAQWLAGVHNPGKIFLSGPKYQYIYVDGVHMHAASYRRLGEKSAEVYMEVVERGKQWAPLEPTGATRTSTRDITVEMHVPYPPLAWDTVLPLSHQLYNTAWAKGRGFEVYDAGGNPVVIDDVTLDTANNRVNVSIDPNAMSPLTLQYAMVQDADSGLQSGTTLGRLGSLRDSDPLIANDLATLNCSVVHGSTSIECLTGLDQRLAYDRIVAPYDLTIVVIGGTTATLSTPWPGPTGLVPIKIVSNEYNYCVMFSLAVE